MFGETWAEIAGTAEGTRKMAQTIGIGRRLNKTGAGKGQPGTETQVEREDQSMRPTRNLISRLERSMDDPKCYRITVRKRQRPQGFWRFRFWGDLLSLSIGSQECFGLCDLFDLKRRQARSERVEMA